MGSLMKPLATSYILEVNEPAGLTEIFQPDYSIVIWKRKPNWNLLEHFSHFPILREIQIREIFSEKNYSLEKILGYYSSVFLHPELIKDLEFLIELYYDLLGIQEVGFRFANLKTQMCPKFHVDFVGIRLLCTYYGRGTEYVERNQENISYLQTTNSIPEKNIQRASNFDVVLLKGERWENNQNRGAIHRSPSVEPEKNRIVLSLDTI